MIDEYVRSLDRALTGPARIKRDLVREARHSLEDAAEAYVDGGLDPRAAGVRAVADFGAVAELAPAYQSELAALSVRTLARRMAATAAVLISGADLMWRGAPWAEPGASASWNAPAPPAGYQVLTATLDLLWLLCGAGALVALAFLSWRARSGRWISVRFARAATGALVAPLGLALVAGVTVFGWSARLWPAAVTWPPMLIGLLAITGAYVWLAHALRACLLTSRQAGAAGGC